MKVASGTRRGARTIYVTTAGPEGVAVRSMIAAWASAGIVKESLWVTPDDLVPQLSGPPVVHAVEIKGDSQRGVDLFTALGTRALESVRLVVVHLLTAEASNDPSVSVAGHTLFEAIGAALPRRAGEEVGVGSTRLRLLNVLIPVSGASHAASSLLMPGWDVNIVVSPEDRPDLDRSTIFVRYPGNFIGHAASALCGLGGLLEGMEGGALDHLELDSTTRDEDVILARFTVRSVVGEDIVEALAEHTFNVSAYGPDGPASLLPGVRAAADPVEIAERAAEHVLATDVWRMEQPALGTPPATKSRRFLRALGHAMAFNARMFGVMTRWLLAALRISVEQRATRVIVGEESGIQVRIGAGPADRIAEAAEQHLATVNAQASLAAAAPPQQLVHLSPTAWTLVREMATALVDGSDLPAAFPEPRMSGRRELLAPTAVVPVMDDVWTGIDERVVEPLDVKGAATYSHQLDDALVAERAKHDDLETAVLTLETEVEVDRAELARLQSASGAAEAEDDETQDAADPPAKGSKNQKAINALRVSLGRREPRLQKAKEELAHVKARIAAFETERARFEQWVNEKASYMRTLVSNLVERRDVLEEEEAAAAKAEAQAPPRVRLVKRQRIVRVIWTGTLIAATVVVGLVVWVGVQKADPAIEIGKQVGIVLGIALVVLILANHWFYRAVRAYEWALAQLIAARRAATERAVWRHAQLAKLDAQSTAMSDWGKILGDVLHRPWGEPQHRTRELAEDVVNELPASMGVAGLSRSTELPFQSIASAARTVYVQGWLTRSFAEIVKGFDDVELEGDSGFSTVDADTSDRPTGPRRRFLEYLSEPRSRAASTESALRRFRAGVESREIPIPTRTVHRRGPFSDDLDVEEPQYFTAAAGESITFASDVFTSVGLQRLAHYVARSAVWLPGSVDLKSTDSPLQVMKANGANAVRVDLSKRLTPDDLIVFGADADSGPVIEEPGEEWPGESTPVWT